MAINIGTVENAKELVFMQGNDDRRYVLQQKSDTSQYGYAEDYLAFITRFKAYQVWRTNQFYIDDTDGKWFACYNVDCFDPPFAVIRARSFESAYEIFCDEFGHWLAVSPEDANDYPKDDRAYNNNGVHIDTDNVQIHPLTLVSVECET